MKLLRSITVLLLAFCLAVTVYAADEVPGFYRKSLNDDLPGRNGDLSDIEKEIKDQALAVLTSLNVDTEKALTDFSLCNAVKMVIVSDINGKEDLGKLYDEYGSDSLRYAWKIPVAETENHYIFATLLINSPADISVTTAFTQNKDDLKAMYLFDRELVSGIVKESSLNTNYEAMMLLSLPALYTDIVIFEADGAMHGIPLSSRDDLLGTESGKIYKLDELNGIISEYAEKLSQSASDELSSGGGSVSTDTEQSSGSPDWSAFILPTVVTVAVACLVYWGIDRKTRNKY